jgi:hypothetical protein
MNLRSIRTGMLATWALAWCWAERLRWSPRIGQAPRGVLVTAGGLVFYGDDEGFPQRAG